MNQSKFSYPYPVLGIGDDILPGLPADSIIFSCTSKDAYKYHFEISLRHGNPDIEQYIKNGYAEYSCEITCSKTLLRRCIKQSSPTFQIDILRKDVNGPVVFNCYISVKRVIGQLKNERLNKDYDGYIFTLEPGDILAVFPDYSYDTEIRYDKLQAAGSFMIVRENSRVNYPKFGLDSQKIEISLPPSLYKQYKDKLGNAFASVIHSSLVLNALTCALYDIDEYRHTLWARTILYRLETEEALRPYKSLEVDKIPLLAQELLGDPYKRLFDYLDSCNLSDEE